MKKVTMSYDDFDSFIELLEKMDFHAGDLFPKKEDVAMYALPELEKYIFYLIWLDETGDPDLDEEGVLKYIRKILSERLDIKN